MHNWLIRNLSLLAFLLVLVSLVYAGLALVLLLGHDGLQGLLAALLGTAVYLVGIATAYGLFLRFLGLCDDIAAIRRHQTGGPASLD